MILKRKTQELGSRRRKEIEFYTDRLLGKGEDKEKIFLPMVRGENAHLTKGFGLGLSIVKRIALLHKGSISYEVIGHGINRFTLIFLS